MNWEIRPLAEVAEVRLGRQRAPKNHSGESMRPYLRAANVTWNGLSLGDVKTMNFTDSELAIYRLDPGDILLSEASGSPGEVGKPALWSGEIDDCAFQNTLIRVRPRLHHPKFLQYYFRWQALSGRFVEHSRGVGIHHLGRARLASWPTPVPPLSEQRRIVDVLETHLSHLDAANHAVTRARGTTRAMLRATLSAGLRAELVQDDLSEGTARDLLRTPTSFDPGADERVWPVPDTWAWARMGDLFQINVGATPSRAATDLWSGKLPWVSSGEVAFSRISATKEHIEREAAGNPDTRIHPPGTVMLAMIGEGKTRGQAAILAIEAAHNQNCASIRVASTKILPEYIYAYLEERYLETRRGGAGGQQPALNKAAIQRLPVPISPLGTQKRLVAAWTHTREAADRLDQALNVAHQRSVQLRRALLAAAFAGRLTGSASDLSVAEETLDA